MSAVCKLLIIIFLTFSGCGKSHEPPASTPGPRLEERSHGRVKVIITADPPQVELHRDILLTISVTAPSEIDIEMPQLDDRLEGFMLSGTFDREPSRQGGQVTWERHARLTPVLAAEYRLAPMAITYTDRSRSPAEKGWFATRPMVFEAVSPLDGSVGSDIKARLKPVWIYPSFKTVALYALLVALAIVVLILAWKLLGRMRREIQLMRMSPRERALKELSLLLAKDLPGKNRIKDFYLELTMIVRRYIERAHSIRAPEQTTEEFLLAVTDDHRFGEEIVAKLKAFLEAADLVKFAAHRPEQEAINGAVVMAREYIEAV